jgi:hypothetical protein
MTDSGGKAHCCSVAAVQNVMAKKPPCSGEEKYSEFDEGYVNTENAN